MDILYCVGTGSNWSNNELKYSLRSIAKYGRNIGKVYVCGYDPRFLSDKVIFIPRQSQYNAKHKNIWDAINYVVKNFNIGEDFLYSSDDHFYVKETDFDNYPIYCKGDLPTDVKDDDRALRYHSSLRDTGAILTAAGYGTKNYSWHGNTHFNKTLFNELDNLWQAGLRTRYGIEPTCTMLNAWVKQYGTDSVINRSDIKIRSILNKQDLFNKLGDRECFSIYDYAISHGISAFLKSEFPDKCIYEK